MSIDLKKLDDAALFFFILVTEGVTTSMSSGENVVTMPLPLLLDRYPGGSYIGDAYFCMRLLEDEKIIDNYWDEQDPNGDMMITITVFDQAKFLKFTKEVYTEWYSRKVGNRTKGIPRVAPMLIPEGTVWNDVRIDFVSQDMVTLSIKGKKESKKFSDMGFTDLRKKIFPGDLWLILKFLGAFNGEINPDNKKKLPKPIQNNLKKWISLLRKKLKEYFQIAGDPFFPCPRYNEYRTKKRIQTFKPGAVYRAKFHVLFTEQSVSESSFQTDDSPYDEAVKENKRLRE